MITFLYAIWICYTVGSLSVIALLLSLTWLAKKEQKKNDRILREMLKARPKDEQD